MKYYIIIFSLLFVGCESTPTTEQTTEKKPQINYYELGKEITVVAQAELLKNVKAGLKKGGPAYAIEYCNIHATPLTDSISKIYNCRISRVAIKSRNPMNAAQGREEKILLNNFLESSLDGNKLRDTLIAENGELLYYRPIMIGMEACLKCHGQIGTDINNETMLVLTDHYPEDKATNYRMGEFRGVWKVNFPMSLDN